MNQLLKEDQKNFSEILHETKQIAVNYLEKQDEVAPGRFIPDIFILRTYQKKVLEAWVR